MSLRLTIIAIRPRALLGAVFFCAVGIAVAADAAPKSRKIPADDPEPAAAMLATLPEQAHGAATALTGDSLRVGSDEVHLAGILAPQGRTETFAAPFATAARDALRDLLSGHTVSARAPDSAVDRRGHLRAQMLRDDGLWLQADLVRRGLARVAATADAANADTANVDTAKVDTGSLAIELLALERTARAAHRGLWSLSIYAVREADDLARLNRDVGSYQVIAGRVANTARRGDVLYLNFGDDYRTDLTVEIPREAWPRFTKLKPQLLTGQRVQVRGWLMRHNGPAITLTVPALLEVVE